MPAPLARGIILSISLLVAAGIAVYDNPQVRQWIDESRRKIAVSLHSLGDDIHPRQRYSRSRSSEDASTREDDSPEAEERRRQVRKDLYERARILEEKRRNDVRPKRTGSFDDIVDEGGRLHEKEAAATTSATSPVDRGGDIRERRAVTAGAALGTAVANPFADEMGMDLTEREPEQQLSRESTATLLEEQPKSPLVIDTEAASAMAGSEMLVDLTPTTSAAPSSFPFAAIDTPTSPTVAQGIDTEAQLTSTNFQSVHEWAEASSASFYSAPESEQSYSADDFTSRSTSQAASLIDADDTLSHADVMSDAGDVVSTPGSWTEVESLVSND